MKKALLAAILLLLVIGALFTTSSYWLGMKAEQEYKSALLKASQWGFLKLTNASYDRGIFTSKAQTQVEFPEAEPKGDGNEPISPLKFALAHTIKHGPLPFITSPEGKSPANLALAVIDTRLVLSQETTNSLKELLGDTFDPSSIRDCITIYFGGNGDSQLIIPAFEHTAKGEDDLSIKWEGLTGNTTFTSGVTGYNGSWSAPSLYIVTKTDQFLMKNLASDFSFHQGIQGLFFGDASVKLNRVEVTTKRDTEEPQQFLVNDMSVSTSSKEAGENVTSSLAMRFNDTKINGDQYGPGTLTLEFRNIDAASVAKLQQATRDAQLSSQQSGGGLDQALIAKYLEMLPGFLKKSPEIELREVRVKSKDGDLWGSAKVSFDGNNAAAVANPLMILKALTVQAEGNIADTLLEKTLDLRNLQEVSAQQEQTDEGEARLSDEALKALAANKTKEQIEPLIAQNLVVHEGGVYKASVSYKNGKTLLNGKDLPLQEMMK